MTNYNVLNIKTVARMAANNPPMRAVIKWTINLMLYILEAQNLMDWKRVESVAIDWERGSLDLGDGFTEKLVARTVSEYYINKVKKRKDFEMQAKIRKDIDNKFKPE